MMETLRHRGSIRRSPRGLPARKAGGPGGGRCPLREAALREKLGGSEQGKAGDRGGAACMAARKTPPRIFLHAARLRGDACAPALHAARGEAPARCRLPPEITPSSGPPRWSCRHPVCGRVSQNTWGWGAYNAELAAAKGRSRRAGRPAVRGGTAG